MAYIQARVPFAKVAGGPLTTVSHSKTPHKLLTNGIEIANWTISQLQAPMSNTSEVAAISERLGLPSLPEMVFGKNRFELFHEVSGLRIEFTTEEALEMVSHSSPKDIKVAASNTWTASNKDQVAKLKQTSFLKEDETSPQDFDWTFTTYYAGSFSRIDPKTHQTVPEFSPTIVSNDLNAQKDGIPLAKLRSTSEPIHWFSHVLFFEDELHDNGIAEMSIRARVMETFWFALVRFWLRVDGVMFRVIDHRMYHEFDSPHIIREITVKEGTWESVHQKIEGDLRKIRDPNEFANHLDTLSSTLEHIILPKD